MSVNNVNPNSIIVPPAEGVNPNNISILPVEVLQNIFSYIPLWEDRAHIKGVDRRFNGVVVDLTRREEIVKTNTLLDIAREHMPEIVSEVEALLNSYRGTDFLANYKERKEERVSDFRQFFSQLSLEKLSDLRDLTSQKERFSRSVIKALEDVIYDKNRDKEIVACYEEFLDLIANGQEDDEGIWDGDQSCMDALNDLSEQYLQKYGAPTALIQCAEQERQREHKGPLHQFFLESALNFYIEHGEIEKTLKGLQTRGLEEPGKITVLDKAFGQCLLLNKWDHFDAMLRMYWDIPVPFYEKSEITQGLLDALKGYVRHPEINDAAKENVVNLCVNSLEREIQNSDEPSVGKNHDIFIEQLVLILKDVSIGKAVEVARRIINPEKRARILNLEALQTRVLEDCSKITVLDKAFGQCLLLNKWDHFDEMLRMYWESPVPFVHKAEIREGLLKALKQYVRLPEINDDAKDNVVNLCVCSLEREIQNSDEPSVEKKHDIFIEQLVLILKDVNISKAVEAAYHIINPEKRARILNDELGAFVSRFLTSSEEVDGEGAGAIGGEGTRQKRSAGSLEDPTELKK